MIRSKYTLVVLLLSASLGLSGTAVHADSPDAAGAAAKAQDDLNQGVTFPHSLLDDALYGRVGDSGLVDYVAIKGDKNLEAYIKDIAGADLNRFPDWTNPPDPDVLDSKPTKDRSVELVFWINAYNAFVINTLANAYPIDSPDNVPGFDTAKVHIVAGKPYSLQDMRAIIGKIDGRGIFAIIDGTKGGPLLSPQAYRFHDIGKYLQAVTTSFVNDPRNINVNRIENKVTVSDYFKNVEGYFAPIGERQKFPSVRAVLATYSDAHSDRSYLTTGDYQIIFRQHDHSLNIKEK